MSANLPTIVLLTDPLAPQYSDQRDSDQRDSDQRDLDQLVAQSWGGVVVALNSATSIPRLCLELRDLSLPDPLVIVSSGQGCRELPAIRSALRAQGRHVVGYFLIDPDYPDSTDSWPDAPITVFLPAGNEPVRSVSLRGQEIAWFDSSEELAGRICDHALTVQ